MTMSRGHYQRFTHFERRSCGRCQNKHTRESVEIIDVDKENVEVVIIDKPETSDRGSSCPQVNRKSSHDGVIYIDDEEKDDDNSRSSCHKEENNKSHPINDSSPLVEERYADEYLRFSREGTSTFSEPRTQPGCCSSKNWYGLDSLSNNESSESSSPKIFASDTDSSDCEIMEDSSGNIREQWEIASSRRKMSRRVYLSSEDGISASGLTTNPGDASYENPKNQYLAHNFVGLRCSKRSEGPDEYEPSSSSHVTIPDKKSDREKGDKFSDPSPDKPKTELRTDCSSSHAEATFGGSEQDIATDKMSSIGPEAQNIPCSQSCFSGHDGDTFGETKQDVATDKMPLMCTKSQDTPHDQDGNQEEVTEDLYSSPNILTSSREKYKESEEYKRIQEEEWASRLRELQIQSEEAQRLKKKKRAERRLLDMERRQKLRIEEVRESQKKDEEIINFKETIRADIRRELDKMEGRYRDMASLLRGLGINVKGGPFPLPQDVNAAYKQAVLKFHPDRASRTDIRQQVEAEEIFKMISRMKEKLLPLA